MAELVAHLKYMWVEQRSDAYDARKPRAQEKATVSGHQLVRMDARSMCEYALSANLLDDNFGSACRNPRCAEYAKRWGVHGGAPGQGKLVARGDVFAVKRATVWRKCTTCRCRHSVQHNHPLYGPRDQIEESVYCHWMFVQGSSATLCALHMGRSEDLVRRYFQQAACICSHDAEYRQARIVFGKRFPLTTIVEYDECRFGKFKVAIDGVLHYYHFVVIGVAQRGDPSKIWLLSLGLTRSAQKGRVPPLKWYLWRMIANTIFDEETLKM